MKISGLMHRWEAPAALGCALLVFLPHAWVRIPAGLLLLCVLPGMSIARHLLRETSAPRLLILSAPLSLFGICAVAIPAAIVAGSPSPALAAGAALLVALVGSLPGPARAETGPPGLDGRHLALLALAALILQAGFSAAIFPDADTIRWKGLPDLIFFKGIHTQITLHTPPLDPENGASLLIHNWIYHFHFALVHLLTGLPVLVMQRVVGAWMALAFLGLTYLIAADLFRKPVAGLVACLFLMTSGEIHWIVRSLWTGTFPPAPPPWLYNPSGLTILSGWYNLAPQVAALAAWYWLQRHRVSGARSDFAASLLMCVALAFFHPVFYGVFMIGMCLWLAWLWISEGPRPAWLLYLATPLPFFLFYKIPYYGLAMPPRVVHLDLSAAGIASRANELVQWGGIILALGAAGLLATRGRCGPLPWLAGVTLLLHMTVRSPNPHWFRDLLYISMALGSGLFVERLRERSRALAWTVSGAALAACTVALVLYMGAALRLQHEYTPEERAAGEWLRRNTGPDDLVAILPNSPSTYTVIGLGDRRVVHGWTGHLLDFHHDARQQEVEVRDLFETAAPERAAQIARRYGASYIYVGAYERRRSERQGLTGPCFEPVLRSGDVELYRFACGGQAPQQAAARPNAG